jgi:hypothetical protein
MKKCKNCRHYRTEKTWYAPKLYPCDSCVDREVNFEPYPEGKKAFDPRKPILAPSSGILYNQKEYREMAENFRKCFKNGRVVAS